MIQGQIKDEFYKDSKFLKNTSLVQLLDPTKSSGVVYSNFEGSNISKGMLTNDKWFVHILITLN